MAIYYWNSETDDIISEQEIRTDYYEPFGSDDYDFDTYLSRCMYYNNGVLHDTADRYNDIKSELNRKLNLAKQYGYDEYADELVNLLAEMHRLSKYTRERS